MEYNEAFQRELKMKQAAWEEQSDTDEEAEVLREKGVFRRSIRSDESTVRFAIARVGRHHELARAKCYRTPSAHSYTCPRHSLILTLTMRIHSV